MEERIADGDIPIPEFTPPSRQNSSNPTPPVTRPEPIIPVQKEEEPPKPTAEDLRK